MPPNGEYGESPPAEATPNRLIPYARQSINSSDIEAVIETLQSDFLTQGPQGPRFESALREYAGVRHAVAVSSGTAALHLACLGLGLDRSHVGVVPAITFVATANALRYCGSQVVFCDVESDTGLSSAVAFENASSRIDRGRGKLRAMLPVSLTGRLPDLEAIRSVADREKAFVIEDAAHSIGAYGVTATGIEHASASCRFTDAATLSFHPVKHICAGEGGAVLTNDVTLARRVRRLRNHGIEKPDDLLEREGPWAYAQMELGYHYRLTDLQAALGRSQLGRLDQFLARRRALAAAYFEAFSSEPFSRVFSPPPPDPNSAWHLYSIRFHAKQQRLEAHEFLRERKILTQVHYMPVYRQPCHAGTFPLPGAEAYYAGCLSLPLYPSIKDVDQERVVEAMREFCEEVQEA